MQIKVPTLGESIKEAIVANWLKKEGEFINQDEPLVELETDKITVEVNAPAAGVLEKIQSPVGATVEVGALLGEIKPGAAPAQSAKVEAPSKSEEASKAAPHPLSKEGPILSPAAHKIAAENNLDASHIKGTGKDGRITKEDALTAVGGASSGIPTEGQEKRVKMTRLRLKIAERLKGAQNTAAILTTFNEIDMGHVMEVRNRYKDVFEKKHGVKLGFMSFFTKAAIAALEEIPAVNAEIDGDEIIYKNYYNIGVAVGTPTGLVVPVLKNAERMSFADIEKTIGHYGQKARDGKLALEDMAGGTFTISNGGVYGSLMSTPILNPPQSGILGLHKIEKRAVVVNDEIVIRPMMYVALSYDHRIIDGKEAVTFLVRVKDLIEDPERLLLEV